MSERQLVINTAVLLRVDTNDPYKVELVDNLFMTPLIREKALAPFTAFLFESLSDSKSSKEPAVTRYAFSEVLLN